MSEAVKNGQRQPSTKRGLSRTINPNKSALEPGTSSKRQRVSRACDQCRNTRAKCDGEQSTCGTCASTKKACTYTTTPKKRGIQAGYVRSLELTLAWLLTNEPAANKALTSLLRQRNGHGQALVTGRDTAGADRLYDQWKQSTLAKGLELLLSGQEIPSDLWETVDEEHDTRSKASGTLGDPSFFDPIPPDSPSTLVGLDDCNTIPNNAGAQLNSATGNTQSNNLSCLGGIAPISDSLYTDQAHTHEVYHRQQDFCDFTDSEQANGTDLDHTAFSNYSPVNSFASSGRLQKNEDHILHDHVLPKENPVSFANNATSPVNLDVLFDDVMNTDSIHASEFQPDFMQNLGFGPGATSADAFFEQLDPFSSAKITPADGQSSLDYSNQMYDLEHAR